MRLFEILHKELFCSSFSTSAENEEEKALYSFKFSDIKKLWPFIHPHWKNGIMASTLLIISSLLAIPQPLFTKYIIDDVIIKRNTSLLAILIGILLSLVIIEAIISFFKKYLFYSFEQDVLLEFQYRFFNRVLRFPKSFFDNKQTGYLMSRLLGDVSQLRMLFSSTVVNILTNILKFAGGLIILFLLHWKLTLISMIILPFFVISIKYFSGKTRKLSYTIMEKRASVSKNFQETISGVELIKTFVNEDRETRKIYSTLNESLVAGINQNTISTFAQLIIGIVSSLGTLFILWFGANEIIAGNLTIGSFIAFNAYLGYLYGPSHFLASIHIQLQSSLAALYRVFALFDLIPEDENESFKTKITKLNGNISLENVYFSYDKHKPPVLNNISFTAKSGETIAIVGPSGAGKSTLVNLIIHLYKITKGRILLDGVDSSNINLRSLRERIGIVSQEVFLFNNSIINNIRYGKPDAKEEEVFEVSKLAHAHEFIMKFDNGYSTKVGERGIKLSSGQKQRISIARTLLKNPDILIFDEPTSALDPLTEDALKRTVFEGKNGKTIIVIAHRLSTVSAVDKIIVLNQGKIVQMGTPETLSKQKGLYKDMCDKQFFKN